MDRQRFIFRSLWHYRRPYLAILLGVTLSTAIITGALVLGDSVRYSLLEGTRYRLGKIRFAIQPGQRLFRQALAEELSVAAGVPAAAVLQSGGIASNPGKDLRINSVTVTGIDECFARFWDDSVPVPRADEAVVSRNVAGKLDLHPGDEMLLRVYKTGKVSPNAPFVAERQPSVAFRVRVIGITGEKETGRFSLKSNQVAPYNIFVSLSQLSSKLELQGLSNGLLAGGREEPGFNAPILDSLIGTIWKAEDIGVGINKIDSAKYEITSERIFFDEKSSKAVISAIPGAERILTYLINSFSFQGRSAPYSFVTAASRNFLGRDLKPGEILINSWLAEDLGARAGDKLRLRYFRMGKSRSLKEEESSFVVKSVIPMDDPLEDRSLMPQFPGISEAGNCRDWKTGAPVDLKKVRDKDEQYWEKFRGTPKAFISLEEGQRIWDNPFGKITAFRVRASGKEMTGFVSSFMKNLKPADEGLIILPVYTEGLTAAGNSTDMGSLFLSLSFFLIAAALVLTALLFSLHARTRMAETGLLSAVGFRKGQILSLLGFEALMVAIPGGILGVIFGIGYTKMLLLGLNTLWLDAVGTTMLEISLVPATLVIGLLTGLVLSILVFALVLALNLRKPLSVLVGAGMVKDFSGSGRQKKVSLSLSVFLFICSVTMFAWLLITLKTGQSEMFLAAGGMMMAACLSFFYFLLTRDFSRRKEGFLTFPSLIIRNAGAGRSRSMAIITLMALGAFSIIITGANRKTFFGSENDRNSGTGGFILWTESSFPVQEDLNSPEGKKQYALEDEPALKNVRFVQMHQLDGEDASCLNLNQVSRPVILSVDPKFFDSMKCYTFTRSDAPADPEHPWLELDKVPAPGVINAFADQTVITWGLRKKLGDTLYYLDESGSPLKVVLKGGLDNSIFQGSLLVSDSLFRIHFPSALRSGYMLIDAPFEEREAIASRLETLFRDHGLMAVPASQRLAAFNAVENTYLSIFMLLGGLGILVGTIGLAIVLLRNLYERRGEIAIYKAVGFTRKNILRIVVAEYLHLLLAGVVCGVIPAILAILPSMLSPAYTTMSGMLVIITLMILINGSLWIFFLAKRAVKVEIHEVLREE